MANINFKLHYFPEIPKSAASAEPPKSATGDRFKTAGFVQHEIRSGSSAENAPPSAEEIEQQLEVVRQQAYVEGFAEGEKIGQETSRREIEAAVDTLGQALIKLDAASDQIRRQCETETVEMAIYIAEKVVGSVPHDRREVVQQAISQALGQVVERRRVRIRLNPEQCQMMKASMEKFSEMLEGIEDFGVEPDGSIAPGGCVIETDFGDIDARMETRMAAIADHLRQQLGSSET